jgi:hypothetical protein
VDAGEGAAVRLAADQDARRRIVAEEAREDFECLAIPNRKTRTHNLKRGRLVQRGHKNGMNFGTPAEDGYDDPPIDLRMPVRENGARRCVLKNKG